MGQELFVAIVGGIISTVVGGLILSIKPPDMYSSYNYRTERYSIDGANAVTIIGKLCFLGMANAMYFYAVIKEYEVAFAPLGGFGVIFIIFGCGLLNAALIGSMFYGIDIFKR